MNFLEEAKLFLYWRMLAFAVIDPFYAHLHCISIHLLLYYTLAAILTLYPDEG